jgi:hypothetical protein
LNNNRYKNLTKEYYEKMDIPHHEILYGRSKKKDNAYMPKNREEKKVSTGKSR